MTWEYSVNLQLILLHLPRSWERAAFILCIFVAILIIWLIIRINFQKKQIKKLSRKNTQIIAENALLEAEHLKFQLQPHTLKNIIAILLSISNKLNKGMNSLSEILEYILYKSNSNLVSIEEEIEFIKIYLNLYDLFISEINSIKFDFSEVKENSRYFKDKCIPHLITAYFIENAFKHGDINNPEFLRIKVKLTNDCFELLVINRIRKNPKNSRGGLGLVNMRKRLDLLSQGKYEIKNSCNENDYYSTLTINFEHGKT